MQILLRSNNTQVVEIAPEASVETLRAQVRILKIFICMFDVKAALASFSNIILC